MKKASVVVAASVGLLATLWTVPTAGADPRFHGRSAGGARFGGGHSFHAHGHSGHKRGFGHHHFTPRHFVTFGVVVPSPVVVYSSPSVFYAPPPYYSAPVFAPPALYSSPAYSQPAPAPPVPRAVEYPTGRYELRGDGITTPYTWVWIPNPPPPPAAPPTAPPAGAPMSGDAPPARRTQIYRWIDEQGVVHWTDRLETVPRQYREEGKTSSLLNQGIMR
jgi:hypothetical protein